MSSIIEQGGLWSDSERIRYGLSYQKIGYQHIKDRRLRRSIPLPPGGVLGDYVPFYFAPRSPMLYTIDRGNVLDYAEGQTPIVHLVACINFVMQNKLDCLFSDRHAELAHAEFSSDLAKINSIVDFDLMKQTYWNDTKDYPDRKEKRQAEFLVYHFFPWQGIQMIGVINQIISDNVSIILEQSNHKPDVAVRRDWYY